MFVSKMNCYKLASRREREREWKSIIKYLFVITYFILQITIFPSRQVIIIHFIWLNVCVFLARFCQASSGGMIPRRLTWEERYYLICMMEGGSDLWNSLAQHKTIINYSNPIQCVPGLILLWRFMDYSSWW